MRIAKSIMAGFFSAALSGGFLLFAGCGGGEQTDGVMVGPTEEVKKSRAAMENQLRENPKLYAPPKGALRKGTRR